MFETAMKMLRIGDKVVPQSDPACCCTDHIYKKERIFDQLRAMNSRINDLAVKVQKAEELKRMKDEKEETRRKEDRQLLIRRT